MAASSATFVQAPKTVLSEPDTGGSTGLCLLDGGLSMTQRLELHRVVWEERKGANLEIERHFLLLVLH